MQEFEKGNGIKLYIDEQGLWIDDLRLAGMPEMILIPYHTMERALKIDKR